MKRVTLLFVPLVMLTLWGFGASLSCTNPSASGDAGAGGEAQSLVTHDAWVATSAAEDPFREERPEDAKCTRVAGFKPELFNEEPSLELQTAFCSYVTLRQRSQAAIRKGDTLRLRIWHFKLLAGEVAQAHLAIMLGETLLWQTNIPIPSDSKLISERFTAPRDIPKGTPLFFHLHNHGANSYHFLELSVQP